MKGIGSRSLYRSEVFQHFLEMQRKATKIFCQDSRSRSSYRSLNSGPLEYQEIVLVSRRRLVQNTNFSTNVMHIQMFPLKCTISGTAVGGGCEQVRDVILGWFAANINAVISRQLLRFRCGAGCLLLQVLHSAYDTNPGSWNVLQSIFYNCNIKTKTTLPQRNNI